MAQQLRSLAALTERHRGSQPPITLVPGNLTLFSDLHRLLHMCATHKLTEAYTQPHNK